MPPVESRQHLTHEQIVAYVRQWPDAGTQATISQLRSAEPGFELLLRLIDRLKDRAHLGASAPRADLRLTAAEIDGLLQRLFSGRARQADAQQFIDGLLFSPVFYQRLMPKLSAAAPELSHDETQLLQNLPMRSDEEMLSVVRRAVRGPAPAGRERFSVVGILGGIEELLIALWRGIQLQPAWAVSAAILILAVAVGQGPIRTSRARVNAAQGMEQLQEAWSITEHDLRPPGGFPLSIFSAPHGTPLPAAQDPALSKFSRALRWDKNNHEARRNLAVYLYFNGRLAQADSLLNVLLASDSLDAEAWNMRGLVAARRGDSSGAQIAFGQALQIRPDYAEAAYNRAQVLQQAGALNEAKQAWKAYLEIDRTSKWSEAVRKQLGREP